MDAAILDDTADDGTEEETPSVPDIVVEESMALEEAEAWLEDAGAEDAAPLDEAERDTPPLEDAEKDWIEDTNP